MSGNWSHAFSLSKQQVKEAEPPGTVVLIGMITAQGVFRQEDELTEATRAREPRPHSPLSHPIAKRCRSVELATMAKMDHLDDHVLLLWWCQLRDCGCRSCTPAFAVSNVAAAAFGDAVPSCGGLCVAHRCFEHHLGAFGEHVWTKAYTDHCDADWCAGECVVWTGNVF